MIRILSGLYIPTNSNIAFSGGVDSLAVAHFLKQGNKRPTLLHFNHGCIHSDKIEKECHEKAEELGLKIVVQKISDPVAPAGISLEEHWRNERYKFFHSLQKGQVAADSELVFTCHHLNDAVETWLWSSFHGEGKIIPIANRNVIRPFLTTSKREFEKYAKKHGLTPVDDPYNRELGLTRNLIRAKIVPLVEKVNPGIEKVIRKKYL